MRDYDMTLAEINPLAQLADGSFVALDAHMEMENEARPRQKALLDDLAIDPTAAERLREVVRRVDDARFAGNGATG